MATRVISQAFSEQVTRFLFTRNFALLWFGQLVSSLGDAIFDTTIVLWITTIIAQKQSWSSLAVSGVFLAIALPSLFLSPFAGVFVDRQQKRRIMLLMDMARAIILGLLFVVSLGSFSLLPDGGHSGLWKLIAIYIAVLCASACSQFFSPAQIALIRAVVPNEYMAQASARNQLIASLSLIIGAPIAAFLFFQLGIWIALIFNACSFLVSFLCILFIRPATVEQGPPAERTIRSFLTDFWEGIGFFYRSPILRAILVCLVLIVLGSSASNTIAIFFLEQNIHIPDSWYGTYTAVAGAGAIVASLLAGKSIKKLGMLRALWITPLIFGIAMLINARLTSISPAIVFRFVLGMPGIVFNVAVLPVVFQITPQEFLGRIASAFTPIVTLASILGVVGAGYLASTLHSGFHAHLFGLEFGPIDTIFTATGLLGLLASLAMFIGVRGANLEASQTPQASHEGNVTDSEEKVWEG